MSYWIQLELPPEGNNTGFMQLDLSRVIRVQVTRENGTPVMIGVTYSIDSNRETIRFEESAGGQFLEEWKKYQKQHAGGLHFQAPEAKAGTIQIARDLGGPAGVGGS